MKRIFGVLSVGLLQATAGIVMTPSGPATIFLSASDTVTDLTTSFSLDSLASPMSVPTAASVTALAFSMIARCR